MINDINYNRNTFLYLIFNQYIITNILEVDKVLLCDYIGLIKN